MFCFNLLLLCQHFAFSFYIPIIPKLFQKNHPIPSEISNIQTVEFSNQPICISFPCQPTMSIVPVNVAVSQPVWSEMRPIVFKILQNMVKSIDNIAIASQVTIYSILV